VRTTRDAAAFALIEVDRAAPRWRSIAAEVMTIVTPAVFTKEKFRELLKDKKDFTPPVNAVQGSRERSLWSSGDATSSRRWCTCAQAEDKGREPV